MPSALEILQEVNPEAVPAAAPPEAANYREADLAGVSCVACSKFVFTGSGDEDIPSGYCSQWEAIVQGDHVSDGFADNGPALDDQGNEIWDFADEKKEVTEVHLTGSQVEEQEGFVVKEVLRTGEWPVIPTGDGIVDMPLKIVRDGQSNKDEGTISLSELVENFKAGAIASPQIPLSDDRKEHKNITRLNTGFVRDLWIVDDEDGSKLVAKMEFTEPDVKEKVLRGTYADVSCGIPWGVISRGKKYGTAVEHVAITNKPYIDGLGPFLAASDKQDEEIDVVHFALANPEAETEEPKAETETEVETDESAENSEITLSYEEQREGILTALRDQLELSNAYEVTDIEGDAAKIRNTVSELTWTVPFSITREDDATSVMLAATREWKIVEEEGETSDKPAETGTPRQISDLEKARRLRELRLSQSNGNEGGSAMPGTIGIEALDGVELSDDQKEAIQNVLSENASLKARTREQEADARIDELKELGLAERPGALKFYRQVFLSDDGGPAVVLLSNDGKEEGRATALEILDQFIEGVKGSDGKVALSDQALASGNDNPPPADAEGEQKSVKERLAEAKKSLYGDDGDEK